MAGGSLPKQSGSSTGTLRRVTSPFLQIPDADHLVANDLAFAIRDRYPVSPGHCLVVPRREMDQWWDATGAEQQAIMNLVADIRAGLLDDAQRNLWFPGLARPDGFNVGFNAGTAAGQTVDHLHVHVIPRFTGDVADPTGGVRHSIPGKGNYLHLNPTGADTDTTHQSTGADTTYQSVTADTAPKSADTAAPPPLEGPGPPLHLGPTTEPDAGNSTSPAEHALAQGVESGDLIQRVLALLDEGRRAATYKPALLMALVELAQERADGPAPLHLPLVDIADRVMQLYWPHTRAYSPLGTVLRQSTTARSRILVALADLRTTSGARGNTQLTQVRLGHPSEYARVRALVADTLAKQPIPRLQRPGTADSRSGYPRFLYDDSAFRPEASPVTKDPVVTLRSGVAQALARSAPLMRIAVQDVWTREVIAINRINTEDEQLRAFLFGADRISLTAVSLGLRDSGVRHCFWCDRLLGKQAHVDHVIPWSYYPNDDLANLVLTDPGCNTDKRDRLVSGELVQRWQQRDLAPLREVAESLKWPFDTERTRTVAISAYRYLADGMPLWKGRRDITVMDAAERARALAELVN